MKFPQPQNVLELAQLVSAEVVGNTEALVTGSNEIHRVKAGELVFVDHPKYYDKAINSPASVILIDQKTDFPEGKALLVVKEPFTAFNTINRHFKPLEFAEYLISGTAEIGENTFIAPTTSIGENVTIGKNCIIHPNVTIGNDTEIGDNVIIHAGTVIGGDAFYYKNRGDFFEKLESVGNVIIEDDVEIGCSCTIDRGVTDSTIIGKNTKLDNLIQIGHDTVIGAHCLIASQVGVAGCCTIGNNVTLWGQVGVKANITIEDNVEVYAQSGVKNNLKEGHKYFGSPAEEAKKMFETLIKIKRL